MKLTNQPKYKSQFMEDINQFRKLVSEQGSKRDYALINLLTSAGLRIYEALCIRLSDCDNIHQTKKLLIGNVNSNMQRLVYLNDEVLSSLNDYIDDRNSYKPSSDNNYLFLSHRSTRLNRGEVNKIFVEYCKIAKLENIALHQLRDFFIFDSLMKGYSMVEIAAMTGRKINSTLNDIPRFMKTLE